MTTSSPNTSLTRMPWTAGHWTHEPAAVEQHGDELVVTAVEGSDAWRHTSYGFVHASEHALLAPFAAEAAVEIDFVLDYAEQFDQAGVFVRVDDETWLKAGVEISDGVAQVGAVVTHASSDWSVAPVPEWVGKLVTVRASRSGDAITIRARVEGEPFRLVRVAPFPAGIPAEAGPFVCAPTRAGLSVRITRWAVGAADAALH